jgi:hypothetical protein
MPLARFHGSNAHSLRRRGGSHMVLLRKARMPLRFHQKTLEMPKVGGYTEGE